LKLKLIALNLLLVIALSAIVWQATVRWNEAQATRRNNLSVKVTPIPPPPLVPAPKPDAAPAAKFADVATKNLFSKDRNPTVVIDPPKVEEQRKMPSLPVVYGVLGLPSGTKAIMAEKSGLASRSVHTGDTIGEFKIASLDSLNIVFDWDGKQISKKIEELIDRTNPAGQASPQVSSGAVPSGGAAQPPPQPQNNSQPVAAGPGKETIPGQRACVSGDTSPAGTVVGGYKKNSTPTPFGAVCTWVQVQ
jgi:hypothetical protein